MQHPLETHLQVRILLMILNVLVETFDATWCQWLCVCGHKCVHVCMCALVYGLDGCIQRRGGVWGDKGRGEWRVKVGGRGIQGCWDKWDMWTCVNTLMKVKLRSWRNGVRKSGKIWQYRKEQNRKYIKIIHFSFFFISDWYCICKHFRSKNILKDNKFVFGTQISLFQTV